MRMASEAALGLKGEEGESEQDVLQAGAIWGNLGHHVMHVSLYDLCEINNYSFNIMMLST